MRSFETDSSAKEYVRGCVDVPVAEKVEILSSGMVLRTFPQELGGGTFSNVYDLSYPAESVSPRIELHDKLMSVFDYVRTNPDIKAATGGGFFFLVDRADSTPRQLGLNLAFSDGRMRSFPVTDRETVLSHRQRLSAEYVKAAGTLSVGNTELSWSGSLTDYETDVKVFANGNSIIAHVQNETTGTVRVLDEDSRYTPMIQAGDTVDIGFVHREDGVFIGVSSSDTGGIDIFKHDVIARMHKRHAQGELPEMRVRTIDDRTVDGSFQGAVSVGPMLGIENFTNHPINIDKSLGSKPPFLEIPLARTALFETADGRVHMRLFDGRPGSGVFPGVTPNQVNQLIKAEGEMAWGCFLDPGQTAKLVARKGRKIASYGNSHYLKWPKSPGGKFVWVPKTGRPVASMITLR